jgi:hypothetical protein
MKQLSMLVFAVAFLGGCKSVSSEQYVAQRTARLRQMYPAGTSKQSVQAKWGRIKPDFSASRPSNGWDAYPNPFIAKALIAIETTSGKKIESVQRYWGPDGLFSLAHCWYYYDSDGRIVDVAWEYMSD